MSVDCRLERHLWPDLCRRFCPSVSPCCCLYNRPTILSLGTAVTLTGLVARSCTTSNARRHLHRMLVMFSNQIVINIECSAWKSRLLVDRIDIRILMDTTHLGHLADIAYHYHLTKGQTLTGRRLCFGSTAYRLHSVLMKINSLQAWSSKDAEVHFSCIVRWQNVYDNGASCHQPVWKPTSNVQ